MAKANEFEKLKSGNIRSAEGRMAYVNLFKATLPQGETNQERAQFGATLCFPAGTDFGVLEEAIKDVCVGEWGADYKKKGRTKLPMLKIADFPKIGLDAAEFEYFFRCSSKERPGVVSEALEMLLENRGDVVYSGQWAKFTVRPYAWDHPTGGYGVSLGLQNVQVLTHRNGERLAGGRVSAESEFEVIADATTKTKGTDALFDD